MREESRRARGVVMTTWAVAAAMLCGCAQRQRPGERQPRLDPGPVPAVGGVIELYNKRVERLEAIESPIELLVDAVDEKGESRSEQGEGNLKLVRPRSVALRIDKANQTFFWLGSNDEKYWWFDLREDEKVALVGTHAAARPQIAKRFGLPVHPGDLLDLAGIAPIESGSDVSIRWADDGWSVILELKGRWGMKRVTVDPENGEARRVEMLDAEGNLVASSRLERYVLVPVRGQAGATARMATRIHADVPASGAKVKLLVHTPVNNGAGQIKTANFQYAELKRRMGIEREIDLDAVEEGPR
jgi:hypothetical protein